MLLTKIQRQLADIKIICRIDKQCIMKVHIYIYIYKAEARGFNE